MMSFTKNGNPVYPYGHYKAKRDFKDDVIYEEWYSGKDEGNDHNMLIGEILTVYKKK